MRKELHPTGDMVCPVTEEECLTPDVCRRGECLMNYIASGIVDDASNALSPYGRRLDNPALPYSQEFREETIAEAKRRLSIK